MEDHYGGPPWRTTMEDYYGGTLWRTTMEDHHGGPPWRTTMEDHYGGPTHYAMKRKFLFTPYITFAAAWWMNGAAWDFLNMKKI